MIYRFCKLFALAWWLLSSAPADQYIYQPERPQPWWIGVTNDELLFVDHQWRVQGIHLKSGAVRARSGFDLIRSEVGQFLLDNTPSNTLYWHNRGRRDGYAAFDVSNGRRVWRRTRSEELSAIGPTFFIGGPERRRAVWYWPKSRDWLQLSAGEPNPSGRVLRLPFPPVDIPVVKDGGDSVFAIGHRSVGGIARGQPWKERHPDAVLDWVVPSAWNADLTLVRIRKELSWYGIRRGEKVRSEKTNFIPLAISEVPGEFVGRSDKAAYFKQPGKMARLIRRSEGSISEAWFFLDGKLIVIAERIARRGEQPFMRVLAFSTQQLDNPLWTIRLSGPVSDE